MRFFIEYWLYSLNFESHARCARRNVSFIEVEQIPRKDQKVGLIKRLTLAILTIIIEQCLKKNSVNRSLRNLHRLALPAMSDAQEVLR